jgi:putative heme-binding domain-containing protein
MQGIVFLFLDCVEKKIGQNSMVKEKTGRGRIIAGSIILALIPPAVVVVSGQTQSSGTNESKSASASEIAGSPAAGKAVFDGAGNCLSCHRVGATGSVVGPNLSDIGAQVSPDELKQKVLSPSATIDSKNRLYRIVMKDGKTVQGRLLNQGPFSVQLLTPDEGLVAIERSQIRDDRFVDPPQMPSYEGKFSSAQIDDLVAYLASLRVTGNR